jgi:hypothetical protein
MSATTSAVSLQQSRRLHTILSHLSSAQPGASAGASTVSDAVRVHRCDARSSPLADESALSGPYTSDIIVGRCHCAVRILFSFMCTPDRCIVAPSGSHTHTHTHILSLSLSFSCWLHLQHGSHTNSFHFLISVRLSVCLSGSQQSSLSRGLRGNTTSCACFCLTVLLCVYVYCVLCIVYCVLCIVYCVCVCVCVCGCRTVGAGVVGSAMAYRMAQSGKKVGVSASGERVHA